MCFDMKNRLIKLALILWIALQTMLVVVGAYTGLSWLCTQFTVLNGFDSTSGGLILPLMTFGPAIYTAWLGYDSLSDALFNFKNWFGSQKRPKRPG